MNRGLLVADVERITGIPRAAISRIERGQQFPTTDEAVAMVDAYGPTDWYPPTVAAILQHDADCGRCLKPLPPSARRGTMYHLDCRR